MTDWGQLEHAYGSADDVPGLLAALSPDPNAEVWGELWSRLCHQGSVYSASFPALPFLLDAASKWRPEARVAPLSLAGAVVASDDHRPRVHDTAAFRATIDALHRVVLDTLSQARVRLLHHR